MPRVPEKLADALLMKEKALARLRVLQAAEMERRLLPADEVRATWSAAFARLRDLAMGVPERVSSRGAHRSQAELKLICESEIEALLNAVSRGEIVDG